MKRQDMMGDCPEEFEDKLKDIIDYCEGKFTEIRYLLDGITLETMDNASDAKDIALSMSDDLY